ncbi:LETM1 and EF-hand domain-containing anon- mitochondrial [Chlorella sorokiniana]|uniref:LETM1 and EF-hand domain-containing anon-mitochondrial n=1 Tax=Chlorella sorokiniana TaxID=3076 RepID=A0A2P6TRT2_CHLSO|nr:LETM1 and EF-hand domain-containing anon- mitochondrial [Chlorella sorokiniana]|eukprot:PRW56758.1 LETM1 and EF-hand domain-containing anon- mitochondrial [Chlorella sorokiniana]
MAAAQPQQQQATPAAAPAAPPGGSGARSGGAAPASAAHTAAADLAKFEERGQRLEALIQLRKLYRNLLRAEVLVEQPTPVYQAAEAAPSSAQDDAAAAAAAEADALRRLEEAVEVVAEMELTAEQIKAGLRSLKACPYDFRLLYRPEQQAAGADELQARVNSLFKVLSQRAEEEVALLPFPSEAAAHAAIDARNARFRLSIPWVPAAGDASPDREGSALDGEGPYSPNTISERLVKAEKAAEQFVARRLQPAVQRTAGLVKETSPEGVVQGLKSSAVWAKGLWNRLNGSPGQPFTKDGPFNLPLPVGTEEQRKQALQQLNVQLDALEKQLQDASKARESRLRKAGLQGRARMASELRDMDNDIAALSKALAVRTLQLEMEYIYGALEDEARDVVGDSKGSDLQLALSRRGSSEEVALLAAEFRQLDEQLVAMAAAVDTNDALFIDDAELAKLATDIPDLRIRLGIGDTEVFGGQGFSLAIVQLRVRESVTKVVDGVLFGVRGVKLLFQDIGSAGKLFWRAVRGGTLKPREVQALRRTVRDILSFVPFTIILIIPLTPVGHVLIFGFIQRYFPGFFPSQFSSRRQELMMKYDALKRQLRDAELQAEAENDEIEYRVKAASAMAALSRGAVSVAGAAPAAAAAVAAATALGGELEVAAAVGAAAAAAGAAAANAVAGGGEDDALVTVSEFEEEEGPAAKAVRQIEERLSAAEDETYVGDVEDAEGDAEQPAAEQGQQQLRQRRSGGGPQH